MVFVALIILGTMLNTNEKWQSPWKVYNIVGGGGDGGIYNIFSK